MTKFCINKVTENRFYAFFGLPLKLQIVLPFVSQTLQDGT